MNELPKSNDFFRTSDFTYLGYVTNNDRLVEFSIDFEECSDAHLKLQQRRLVINDLFANKMSAKDKNALCSGNREVYFSENGRNYVITPKKTLTMRAIAAIFKFLKIIKNESRVEYKIVESKIPHLIYKPKASVDTPLIVPLQVEGYTAELANAKPYKDPFTKLATQLFQDYEPFHSWKDVKHNTYRDASAYQLVMEGDSLVAKPIGEEVDKDAIRATLMTYLDYLYSQFGEATINRIQTHYEFSLEDMIKNATPLTPEIVYRLNVGTSHIEANDVEQLTLDIQSGNKLPKRIAEKIQTLPSPIDTANPEHFAKLMDVLRLTETEQNSIFTGRRLHGKISSWYTQGDDTLFKPWVDQQEFSQTCFKIPNRDWNCFYEDLAMILCKKHLHQKNPDGTYRIGALIPAPKEDGKPQSYYKVSSWIHNSRGIFSYTLEPACPGTNLPAIKLYRSTSVSSYNLDGAASYKNDFNPINPPGYEGAHLVEPYENEFFNKRTIPVWVGYQEQARRHIEASQLDKARSCLESANKALIGEIATKYQKPKLEQFIRTYDAEFMELIGACRDAKAITPYQAWYLLNNSLRNTVKYHNSKDSEEVVNLKAFLEKAKNIPQFKAQATELLSWWSPKAQIPTKNEKQLIDTLQDFKHELKPDLSQWSDLIHKWAKANNEDIESKTAQNLDFVGHSLGAACAQRFLVSYTASKGRIPLPDQTVSARIFDDPAISGEDNEAFVSFGNAHSDLLASLQAKFVIVRRQEAGDPVPQSGETHLGAAKTIEEQNTMRKWLRFDAALQKPSSSASDPQVRDYATAHGRLYAGAKPMGAWRKSLLQRIEPQKLPQRDYTITYFDQRTQWNFDHPESTIIWSDLRKIWKLPFKFNPIYAERLRTYLSAAFRSGYFQSMLPDVIAQLGQKNPNDDITHGNWKKHCDDKGVFRVFERSKPQASPEIED